MKQNNIEKTLFYYDKTLENCKDSSADIYRDKGDFLYDLDRYKEAKECYQKSIDSNQKLPNTYGNYARLMLTLGKYDKAKNLINIALDLNKEKENALLLELYFYNYCILNENYEKTEEQIEYLLSKNIKSSNFDLDKVMKKSIELGNKKVEKLKEFNRKITEK